jgi:carbon monoxide dehydrogenase subunit G
MKVEFSLVTQVKPNATATQFEAAIADMEAVLNLFPKLESITADGADYYWKLKPIGAAGVERDVSYGTSISVDADNNRVDITPIDGHGNAHVGGYLVLSGSDDAPVIELSLGGSVDIDIPFVLRGAAKPFIRDAFERLVQIFADRIKEHVESLA